MIYIELYIIVAVTTRSIYAYIFMFKMNVFAIQNIKYLIKVYTSIYILLLVIYYDIYRYTYMLRYNIQALPSYCPCRSSKIIFNSVWHSYYISHEIPFVYIGTTKPAFFLKNSPFFVIHTRNHHNHRLYYYYSRKISTPQFIR